MSDNHKNSGGTTMSLSKSANRSLPLLAGSSIAAAALATATFTGVSLAPVAAQAANECAPVGVDPSANGGAADVFACSGAATYQTSGITYSSNGALTVNSTGAMNVGAVGVNLTGNTADNVTFTANNTITGTDGAVIDVTTASGNISVTTFGVTANTDGNTNAVRLESTGGGDITFVKNQPPGNFNPATTAINNDVEGADAAISAITNGGDINLTINTGPQSQSLSSGGIGGVGGRLRGILAQTSGSGGVTLTVEGSSGVTVNRELGEVAVDIVAGTGGVDINVGGQVGGLLQAAGLLDPIADNLAIRVASASAVTVDNTNGLVVGGVDFSGVTAGGVVFDNPGNGPTGGGQGGIILAQGGRWLAAGDSVFSGQADTVNLAGFRSHSMELGTTIDFGDGSDVLNMTGILVAKGAVITNLEAFNNAGAIFFGGEADRSSGAVAESDGAADDLLSMQGATFTGSGASHLYMDVILGGVQRAGCEVVIGVGDCLDLRDGTTAGSTILTIRDVSPGAQLSGYLPQGLTLVDVSGAGSAAAEHFTFDVASTGGYVHPVYGPAFDRPGAFVYMYRYDAENQRHVLISQPKDRSLFDYAVLTGAAQSIWHLTSGTVTSRQTDLRDGAESGSVWLRTAGEVTRRDTAVTFDGWDGPLSFDNSYNLYAGTIMGGMDLLSGARGAFDYALGAQIGYVSSSLDMEESESSGRFTGATGGLYASLWSDWFFLDSTVNLNGLALDFKHPVLGSKTTTYVNSVGVSAEAGTRTGLTENTFAEPLMAASWVRTSFEEISLAPGEVELADAESLRAGLGLRLGATLPGETVSASYFVTGRGWYEFEGESEGLVHNPGADLPFADELTGAFGEAELGVNIYNASNTFSGFGAAGVKWKDGYNAVNLSLGLRLAW